MRRDSLLLKGIPYYTKGLFQGRLGFPILRAARAMLGFVYGNIGTRHFFDPSKGTGLGRAVFRLMRPQVNKHPPCGSRPVKDFFTTQRDSLLHKGIPHYTKGFLTTHKEFFTTQRDSLLHKGIPVRGARFPRNAGY